MRTKDLISKYFENNFFLIQIGRDSKIPVKKLWTEKQLGYYETFRVLQDGYNIGVVGGRQSRSPEGLDLVMLDFDGRLGNGSKLTEDIELYRKLNTCIQFTPKGFHVLLRVNPQDYIKERVDGYIRDYHLNYNSTFKLHRTTLDPKHEDNTFDVSKEEHDEYFLDTIRWTSMYILCSPSKVNGKSYWWLDDMEGDILKI